MNIADKPGFYREAFRALRPGGCWRCQILRRACGEPYFRAVGDDGGTSSWPRRTRRARPRADGVRRRALRGHDGTHGRRASRATLAIRERLAAADPANAEGQRNLSISHFKLGYLAVAASDNQTADQHYRTSLAITERLAAADPGNAQYQAHLVHVRHHLAEVGDASQ